MSPHHQYAEDIYESFQEDEILDEVVMEDVDKSTKKEPDFFSCNVFDIEHVCCPKQKCLSQPKSLFDH